MKQNQCTLGIAAMLMLTVSCTKESGSGLPESSGDYSKLEVGNYWVYERYEVDSTGNVVSILPGLDSCYVESDTSIGGETYYKMVRPHIYPPMQVSYLRDSAGCIVNSEGVIVFTPHDFTNVLSTSYVINPSPLDTLNIWSSKMVNENVFVNVPAGGFITSTHLLTIKDFTGVVLMRYYPTVYAKNVGIVQETRIGFSSQPNSIQWRLLRYHVN